MRDDATIATQGDAEARRDPHRMLRFAVLLGILAFSIYVRLSGISWGLRHPVHRDEQDFVTRVVAMVEAGDLDHRWYQYPGLFIYLLAPGVALLGPERWGGPDAYWVCRLVVAAFGVANTALVYVVGSRLIGSFGGLTAALLLAAAPIDVHAFHQVRADVVLQTMGILCLLALRGIGPSLRGDARMGVVIGLATAVKFTGVLMAVPYLAARLLAPGPRVRGPLVAGLLTVGVTLACTPYALIHADRYFAPGEYNSVLGGPTTYYSGEARFMTHLASFLNGQARAAGTVGVILFFVGVTLALREAWKLWLPALLHPVVVLLVMSGAAIVFPRHLSPAFGVMVLLAALPVERAFRWNRVAGLALAAAVVAHPVLGALALRTVFVGPSPEDKALDWIEQHVPPGARVLETRPGTTVAGHPGAMIGLDPKRHEVLYLRTDEDRNGLRLLVPHVDVVISGPGEGRRWSSALNTVQEIRGPLGNLALKLRMPRRDPRASYRAVDLSLARLSASENPLALGALRDGDSATSWRTLGPAEGTEWLQVDLQAPTSVARVELRAGHIPSRHDPELQLAVSEDGRSFHTVRTVAGRPPIAELVRAGRSPSQVLILAPVTARSLRIAQLGSHPEGWAVTELRIEAPPD